ncbi:trimethyltridecatetraene synthase-like [Salvia miltiorrhiza]|uniref:trimethyltridecatetraene synthase-like n=1 Tax=Salvia miltiorrhiza TaxID=226208 RepID=UPI0025AC7533|nr:trimethyltridecatetraene synthase-like [Salvia miltiorrhiza]
MENPWLLLALLSALAIAFISKIVFKTDQKLGPPGPKPWPIIGNLNLLGSIPHQSLHHLSQKYGEIMLLKLGKFPVVVASSPKMAEQFLKVHDAAFASRPPALAAGKHISYDNSDVSFSPYGPYWREARKILMSELLGTKKLDQFEQIRVEARRSFFSRLKALSGKPVVLREHLSRYIMSTICRMVMTNEYVGDSSIIDDGGMAEMMRDWFVLTGVFNIGDWIPWLGPLDLQGYVRRMKAFRKKSDSFFGYVIDDHIARRRDGSDKDFVDALLDLAEDPNAQLHLTRDSLKSLIMNVVLGGPDTSITTVEWALHEMFRQPRIFERARAELDAVIGRDRWVEENDFTQLPYVDAIIMETFRLHPIATFLAPHYAIQDCNVAGYNISKGTSILINTWSIGRDPNTWDAAEEFLPERFMGKQTDMTGGNFALLPFGSGRRICPAYNLGLKIVRTTLANLLHGFEVELEEGMRGEDVSLEEQYGLATNPKHPVSIIVKPTLPAHLY